jgi:hypothetical protein
LTINPGSHGRNFNASSGFHKKIADVPVSPIGETSAAAADSTDERQFVHSIAFKII